MKVNWGAVARTGLGIAGALVPAVNTIEQLARTIPALQGAAKEDAAVALSKETLEAAEGLVGKELLADPQVEVAARAFIQGYVALQHAVSAVHAVAHTPVPSSQN